MTQSFCGGEVQVIYLIILISEVDISGIQKTEKLFLK